MPWPLMSAVANDGGFRDRHMSDERAFDFRRAEAVTGNIDDIIDAAGDPVIAVASRRQPSPVKYFPG